MQPTILGETTIKTDEQLKAEQINNWKWERAIKCCENDVKAYADGQINFETTVTNIVNVLDKVKSDFDREKAVYQSYYIKQLIKITPSTARIKNNGVANWMIDATYLLLVRARKDNYSLTKTITIGKKSAFEKVADLWNDAGKSVSSSQIASWYSNKPKKNRSKNRNKIK